MRLRSCFHPRPTTARWLLVAIALVLAPWSFGQTDESIRGTVTEKNGRPVVGVMVIGALGRTCCPFKREQTTTDQRGEFRLDQPGAVIHFYKDDFRPLALVLRPGTAEFRVTIETSEGGLIVPACSDSIRNQKLIGWGDYGVHFAVPEREVKMEGGKPDVDYVRYVIKPRAGESWLEFWFGPYAMSTEPDDEQFVNSVDFSQRNVEASKGKSFGIDSSGRFANGRRWRQTAILGQGGARYLDAAETDANLFDRIIDSICLVPHPNQ
jgi:hypothetical protein